MKCTAYINQGGVMTDTDTSKFKYLLKSARKWTSWQKDSYRVLEGQEFYKRVALVNGGYTLSSHGYINLSDYDLIYKVRGGVEESIDALLSQDYIIYTNLIDYIKYNFTEEYMPSWFDYDYKRMWRGYLSQDMSFIDEPPEGQGLEWQIFNSRIIRIL